MNYQDKEINGVLLIDKESGLTSHDVVDIARKKLGIRKIGHCGTLDPMATGLLMLVIGKGTKLQDLLMSENKVYEGTIKLGQTTSTQDKEGEVIETLPVGDIPIDQINQAFEKYKGDFEQIPPMVSAIKSKGVPLYKLARKGITIERKPRAVHIYNYKILNIELPLIEFNVKCSKGFYVRTYAHDIGNELKVGAHLSALRRISSGNFFVKNAVPLDKLKNADVNEIYKSVISLYDVSKTRIS